MNRVCWLKDNKNFVEINYQEIINIVNGACGVRVCVLTTIHILISHIWFKILPQLQFTRRVIYMCVRENLFVFVYYFWILKN